VLLAAKSNHDPAIASSQQYNCHSLANLILSKLSITGKSIANITIISMKSEKEYQSQKKKTSNFSFIVYLYAYCYYIATCSWNTEWNPNSLFLRLK